jgi:hypothetical protein
MVQGVSESVTVISGACGPEMNTCDFFERVLCSHFDRLAPFCVGGFRH